MTADLLYSSEEEELRASLGALLAARCPSTRVLAMYDGDASLAHELWPAVGIEMGLAGLLIPESYGGAGATARKAGVVLEELGRSLAPVPFLTSSVIAVTALLSAGYSDTLPLVADGSLICALTVPLGSCVSTLSPTATLDEEGLVHGRVDRVAGLEGAGLLLVPATDVDGELVLTGVRGEAALREQVTSLDMSRPIAGITFDGAPAQVIARGAVAENSVRRRSASVPHSSPPSSSASRSGASTPLFAICSSGASSAGSSAATRRSSTAPPISSSRSRQRGQSPGTPLQPARMRARTASWRLPSPRRTAPMSPSMLLRSAFSSTVASASPGSIRPICISSGRRPIRLRSGRRVTTAQRSRGSSTSRCSPLRSLALVHERMTEESR